MRLGLTPRKGPFTANDDGPGIARAHVAVRILALMMLVLFAASLVLFAHQVMGADLQGKVVNVHDGDTLTLLRGGHQIRVRLVDIDAPELGQAFGKRSRESLAGMCAGAMANVEARGRDRYGRTLGRVTCGQFDANAEQVRRGMAWVFVRYAPTNTPLYQVQTEARLEHRGLWSDMRPIAPWEWRGRQRHALQRF